MFHGQSTKDWLVRSNTFMDAKLYIDGEWVCGNGRALNSVCPSTEKTLWQGHEANPRQVVDAMSAAKNAFTSWAKFTLDQRISYLEKYQSLLEREKDNMALLISKEVGKPLWESKTEVSAMIKKIAISIKSFHQRTPLSDFTAGSTQTLLTHKAHGVFVVLGPYNFPGHLPNGHIVPALLAGNTVVFKPSDYTPMVAQGMIELLHQAGLPKGVVNLVYGKGEVGQALLEQDLDGVLFTGSYQTGKKIHAHFAGRPEVILALEMGGNNPLIVSEVSDMNAAVFTTIMSAFITAGQRCTCARRLYVPNTSWGQTFLKVLVHRSAQLIVDEYTADPEPFMGPVISHEIALSILAKQQQWHDQNGEVLLFSKLKKGALLTPGIIDLTQCRTSIEDEEIFGPVLQVYRYDNFEQAVDLANNTKYGLSSGLISDNKIQKNYFYQMARAGIVNINKQLTGASSSAPFGGVGCSGNHRASAFYAADFCAFPMASMTSASVELLANMPSGMNWDRD